MFTKHDIDFEEMAADLVRRRAQIASLTRRRPFMFCGVMVIFICTIVEMWTGGKGAISGVLSTAIFWGIYIKQESDLRLLRVIDWLQKGRDEKPAA
jgi:hypothetical protein